jgi:hypothetical protein
MLKYHSVHGHLYHYIGDYWAYLSYSVQLKFIYRGTDKAHDVILPRLESFNKDWAHD